MAYSEGVVTQIKFRAWIEKEQKMKPVDNMDLPILMNKGTIMQYTGLLDKNGEEIYDGDIVRHLITKTPKDSYTIKNIIFSDGAFCVWGEKSPTMLGWISSECIEIIGNIYENPELLEKL